MGGVFLFGLICCKLDVYILLGWFEYRRGLRLSTKSNGNRLKFDLRTNKKDMKINVKAFAEGKSTGEVVKEAKRVLKDLAVKYNCQFEVTGEKSTGQTFTSQFKSKVKKESGSSKVFLSFGGEIDM